jgi:hypothetical protein
MNVYAEGVREVMDRAWENEGYKNWAGRWLYHCGLDPEQIERRRREFEKIRDHTRPDSDTPLEMKAAGGQRILR